MVGRSLEGQLAIETKWPWGAVSRATSPAPLGDVVGAAAFLGVDQARLAMLGDLLCAGVPDCEDVAPTWEVEDGGWCMSLHTQGVVVSQLFGRDSAGRLNVDFRMLVLPEHLQAKSLLRTALRNAAIVYDELGVEYCSAFADFDIGSYAWAKLGAAPLDPETCRIDLSSRLDDLTRRGRYTASERAKLEILVRDTPSDALMHEVASATDAGGQSLGKDLLLGYKWDALWRVNDSEHRTRVMEALR